MCTSSKEMSRYNVNAKYTLYKIKANEDIEIATLEKIGLLDTLSIEMIVNKFLYKQYKEDYKFTLIEVNEYLTNPNYIQDKVAIYVSTLFLDGYEGNMNYLIDDYVKRLHSKLKSQMEFLQKAYVPKSFDLIMDVCNIPEIFESDSYEIYDIWMKGIDFVIKFDTIDQT